MTSASDPTSGNAPDPNQVEQTFVGGKKSGRNSSSKKSAGDSGQRNSARQGGHRLTDQTPEANPSARYQEMEEIGVADAGLWFELMIDECDATS